MTGIPIQIVRVVTILLNVLRRSLNSINKKITEAITCVWMSNKPSSIPLMVFRDNNKSILQNTAKDSRTSLVMLGINGTKSLGIKTFDLGLFSKMGG